MDYDSIDAKLSFRAKFANGQKTWPYLSSATWGVRDLQNSHATSNKATQMAW